MNKGLFAELFSTRALFDSSASVRDRLRNTAQRPKGFDVMMNSQPGVFNFSARWGSGGWVEGEIGGQIKWEFGD